jgi:hypothetical protein
MGMQASRAVACAAIAFLLGYGLAGRSAGAAPSATGSPATSHSATASSANSPPTLTSPLPGRAGCLATGNGYLRAKIRGALNLDLDWHDAEIECDGGARPDGSGVRVSFAGPLRSDGRRLRMVFGVGTATEGSAGHDMPTNLTVIFEGEQRLYATRGEDKCTVDELQQQRFGTLDGKIRTYRVTARGFCISPATTLDDAGRILVTSFDFAGRVTYGNED